MGSVIQIDHLTKTYNLYDRSIDRLKEVLSISKKKYHVDYSALDDISLSVNKGESIGLIGENGAGKSTLLKIITGVLTPSSGTCQVDGRTAALLELGAGFNMEYTGVENIYLNGRMMGISRERMKERVGGIIEFADIGNFIDQPVKTYSSGMFARLAFAVSINVEPDILIVDEALSVGDIRFQTKCIDKMKELKDAGTTVLFVTHATEQVKRFCTRAIWMDHGHIVMDGEASEIVDLYETHMKMGISIEDLKDLGGKKPEVQPSQKEETEADGPEKPVPHVHPGIPAYINEVRINQKVFHTFDTLEVAVEYEVCDEIIEDLMLGVAIYSVDRKIYVFGPNTSLDKASISNKKGTHTVTYTIPKLPLIQGAYVIDAGIFNNEGIVNLDYKTSVEKFVVNNRYFSEGLFYMEHRWSSDGSGEEEQMKETES